MMISVIRSKEETAWKLLFALCDSFEKQANDQGLTFGDKAEFFDRVHKSYNLLRIRGYLTDSQSEKVMQKIQKDLIKNLKRLDKEDKK